MAQPRRHAGAVPAEAVPRAPRLPLQGGGTARGASRVGVTKKSGSGR
jgi:hypothetical protein